YISFFIYKRKNRSDVLMQSDDLAVRSRGDILRSLLLIALPIALSSIVSNMMDLIDSGTIPGCLSALGYTQKHITDLYGQLTSKAQTLVNVPMVLGSSLAVSLVPAISESMARKDREMAVSKVTLAVKLTFLVSLPAALGLSLLSKPIIELLYPNSVTGYEILRWHAFTVIFSMGMLVLLGILQGAGRYYVPLVNVIIGGAVKLVCNLMLVRVPELNIYGAILSTVIAGFTIFTLNFIAVRRHIGFGKLVTPLAKILLSVAVMGVACVFSFRWMSMIISSRIAVLGSIGLSVVVYAMMVLLTKAVTMDDLKSVRS
ncbi:MAG: polysaccharide biosynthesis C-terminal domain-containing protein, partial [Eubacteriaceae bacterium]|nr:polysaccharide biosynthesis C-terminal domain-containing protein [Eubacteriaceae bacterium]